jgi:hypothetical protein
MQCSRPCGSDASMLLVLFLFVESILFGLFTQCMLVDQLSSLRSNQTQIDKLKNQKHAVKVEVNEVCGTHKDVRCHWGWFFPIPVSFSEIIREQILGYRIDYSKCSGQR